MLNTDFTPTGLYLVLVYGLLALAFCIAVYLVKKYDTPYKLELGVIAFYLLTGNYNQLLTLKIPGLSLFEIQPDRFIFLVLSFYLIRQFLSSGLKIFPGREDTVPWFKIALFLYITSVILSQATHLEQIGFAEVAVQALHGFTFLVVVIVLPLITDRSAVKILAWAFIIGAVFTSIISLIQLGFDHGFMRSGEARGAFGSVLRSIGMYREDYSNSYAMITGIYWTLVTVKRQTLKMMLTALLFAGILTTFHRMSWLITGVTLSIYFLRIEKLAVDRLALTGLIGLALILSVLLFAYRDIANSTLVKERLADSVDGRKGYWKMVADNIGDKPIFGFGGKDNDVYYYNMLLVTKDRKRATGDTGDIHNGYLQAMFFYGIPSFFFFATFVIMAFMYFSKLVRYHLFFAVPLLFSLLYLMANFTNNFLFDKHLALICAVHLGIGLGAQQLEDPLAEEEEDEEDDD